MGNRTRGGVAFEFAQAHAFAVVAQEHAAHRIERALQGAQARAGDINLVAEIDGDAFDFLLDLALDVFAFGTHGAHRGMGGQIALFEFRLAAGDFRFAITQAADDRPSTSPATSA
jgi:hypothetical protein